MLVLDGSSGMFLKEGFNLDISGPLWSAKILNDPSSIQFVDQMHTMYLEAGADIISSISYQASKPTFIKAGFEDKDADRLFKLSLDQCFKVAKKETKVGISLGSFGCSLPDCAEYSGDFGSTTLSDIMEFHRWRLLKISEYIQNRPLSDFYILFETIPCLLELEAITCLMKDEFPQFTNLWITLYPSKILKNQISENWTLGNQKDTLKTAMTLLSQNESVKIIGINCFDPLDALDLIQYMKTLKRRDQMLACYPNGKDSLENLISPQEYGSLSLQWKNAGADIIGGCCYTTPKHIECIRLATLE